KARRAFVAKHAAGIDKGRTSQAVFLGNAGDGTLKFSRGRPIHTAADIIHGRAGREVARTKAVWRKGAHHARAAEEIVQHWHLLTAPAGDEATLSAHHGDE